MAFKSARLLQEAINKEMDELRKLLMSEKYLDVVIDRSENAQEKLIDLRKLVDELGVMAMRPAIDDVLSMSPGDYVTTMKPLVGKYHRQLMVADALCSCLNEDLQANATILMLVGDEKTVVRTAHDPNRPEVGLAVEVILASLDNGTKNVLGAGAAELEKMAGLPAPSPDDVMPEDEGEIDRCAVCGWPLKDSAEEGCVRGNCSQRPRPERLYDGKRAAEEQAELMKKET